MTTQLVTYNTSSAVGSHDHSGSDTGKLRHAHSFIRRACAGSPVARRGTGRDLAFIVEAVTEHARHAVFNTAEADAADGGTPGLALLGRARKVSELEVVIQICRRSRSGSAGSACALTGSDQSERGSGVVPTARISVATRLARLARARFSGLSSVVVVSVVVVAAATRLSALATRLAGLAASRLATRARAARIAVVSVVVAIHQSGLPALCFSALRFSALSRIADIRIFRRTIAVVTRLSTRARVIVVSIVVVIQVTARLAGLARTRFAGLAPVVVVSVVVVAAAARLAALATRLAGLAVVDVVGDRADRSVPVVVGGQSSTTLSLAGLAPVVVVSVVVAFGWAVAVASRLATLATSFVVVAAVATRLATLATRLATLSLARLAWAVVIVDLVADQF